MSISKRLLESRTVRRKAFNIKGESPYEVDLRQDSGNNASVSPQHDSAEIEAFNEKVKAWSAQVTISLLPSIRANSIAGIRLSRSINNNFQSDSGEIFRLGFSFARHGIFVHKGVGRGYQMHGGAVVKTSRSPGFHRRPKPWFNPVVEARLDELGGIIHDHTSRAIMNASRIFIR